MDDLGDARPHCLWVRGTLPILRSGPGEGPGSSAVALVGSRACTTYGRRVAADLAHGLASRGVVVVSGGAFGIDAAAHRGALAAGASTVVVLAGGIDQPYPAAHRELFDDVVAGGGALVGEAAPGATPLRSRFLQRNRLIAAMSGVTVVVEAAWRSGALSTAHHGAQLLRPVGAVPGPVTSAASAGCHRLLREGCAVCVTDAAEVLELAGPLAGEGPDRQPPARPLDGVDPPSRMVHEALSLRLPSEPEDVAVRCGLEIAAVRASLGRLELAGLAVRSAEGWRARRA
ncbi:MAG: DNA-processing protein DprA [Cellulomonas sp.]|nr:DNA-processing protein DprA [Cellulomonas sp.]